MTAENLRVLHIPFCFYPDPVGGTEVCVEALARRMQRHGATVVIAAPGKDCSSYVYDGLSVRRFGVSEDTDIRNLYGDGDPEAAQQFAQILDDERPCIVHLHAFTNGVSLRAVREAKRRGIKVMFTYHTPTVSCQRGTLMRWGTDVCDGVLDLPRCAACTLDGLGVSKLAAKALSRVPTVLGTLLGNCGLQAGLWTALRMPELLEIRHSAFRALVGEVDHVTVPSHWSKDLLESNGVPAQKITLCRYGLAVRSSDLLEPKLAGYAANGEALTERIEHAKHAQRTTHNVPEIALRNRKSELRIAFLGRLDPTKGADILIRSLRSIPNARVELHLYGIAQGKAASVYLDELKKLAQGDSRTTFLSPVPSHLVVELLQSYDLLAVPSRWLETGPLVVLEAFGAGIPVLGSNLGGIAELVENDVNGILLEADSVNTWSQAILRCSEDRAFYERLRRGVRPPRRMDALADEMLVLYRKILEGKIGCWGQGVLRNE